MRKDDDVLEKMREICLSLPDTRETITWGQPHFRVGEKIFSGYGEEKGKLSIGFKLEREHADAVVRDPRFTRSPFGGQHGWVSMDASRIDDWELVRELVQESYRLIAPKRTLKKLDAAASPAGEAAKPPRGAKPRPARKAKGQGERSQAAGTPARKQPPRARRTSG